MNQLNFSIIYQVNFFYSIQSINKIEKWNTNNYYQSKSAEKFLLQILVSIDKIIKIKNKC